MALTKENREDPGSNGPDRNVKKRGQLEVTRSLREVNLIILSMRKDKEEIAQLKAETRHILDQLNPK